MDKALPKRGRGRPAKIGADARITIRLPQDVVALLGKRVDLERRARPDIDASKWVREQLMLALSRAA